MRLNLFLLLLLSLIVSVNGETIYFLVAEKGSPTHGDSYVLALTEPNDINHARDLVEFGPGIGQSIIAADIAAGADGINRSFSSPAKAPWNWHVTNFVSFADITAEIYDGWPGLVQNDVQWWINNTGGQIGFWDYTIVAELGTDTKSWRCDFDSDGKVRMDDLAELGTDWRRSDCNSPDWCDGTDLDKNGILDYNDLAIFADNWLNPYAAEPLWFNCWDCPYQCHGDADYAAPAGKLQYRVNTEDLSILTAAWGTSYPDLGYIIDGHCADFDRDGDVDDDDNAILDYWYEALNVPNDCTPESFR